MSDFVIDDGIKKLLPPHSKDEFDCLETLLLDSLDCEPLVLLKIEGNSKLVLGDGHHRHAICIKHGIPFTTKVRKFKTRELAIEWVIKNQLGRRNLTDELRAYYIGKEYLNLKKSQGNPQFRQNDGIRGILGEAAKKVAKEHGVSERTVERNAAFAEAVDKLPEPEKNAVLTGHSGNTKTETAKGKKPVLCERCLRVGAVEDCQSCKELRAEKKDTTKSPKSGRVLYTFKNFESYYGALLREIDALGNAYKAKESSEAKALRKQLGAFREAFTAWHGGLTK